MKRRTRSPADDLGEQDLDFGLRPLRGGPRYRPGSLLIRHLPLFNKKAGASPASQSRPCGREKLCACQVAADDGVYAALPRAVAVDPVVAPFGFSGAASVSGLRASAARPSCISARPEAEQRVVVGRRALDDGLELRARLLELARSGSTPGRAPRGSRSSPARVAAPSRAGRSPGGSARPPAAPSRAGRGRRHRPSPPIVGPGSPNASAGDRAASAARYPRRQRPPRAQAPSTPPPRPSSDRRPRRCARVGVAGASR